MNEKFIRETKRKNAILEHQKSIDSLCKDEKKPKQFLRLDESSDDKFDL